MELRLYCQKKWCEEELDTNRSFNILEYKCEYFDIFTVNLIAASEVYVIIDPYLVRWESTTVIKDFSL